MLKDILSLLYPEKYPRNREDVLMTYLVLNITVGFEKKTPMSNAL